MLIVTELHNLVTNYRISVCDYVELRNEHGSKILNLELGVITCESLGILFWERTRYYQELDDMSFIT